MHTREGGKHTGHAAPRATHASAALAFAAAGLEGARGLDTTTWMAERMSEASAAVVSADPGAAMGGVAGMSRQQRFGPNGTHSLHIRVQRQLVHLRRPQQHAAFLQKKIARARRSEGKRAYMSGRFFSRCQWRRLIACGGVPRTRLLQEAAQPCSSKSVTLNNQVRAKRH